MQYLINTVPARLKDDPGLAYERYLYRVEKGRWQDAEAYLLEKSTSATALGRPEMWMERRANLARQALEDGDVAGAYRIAAQNFGSDGPGLCRYRVGGGVHRADADGRPEARDRAFHPLPGGGGDADQPRAGRLLAGARVRGEPATPRRPRAPSAWGRSTRRASTASSPPRSSACPPDAGLAGGGTPPDWRDAPFMQSSVVKAAYFLHLADDDRRASQFFRHAAEGQPPATRAALAQMAIDLGRPQIGIRIAKDAAAEGMILRRPVLSAARRRRGGRGRCRRSS